MALRFHATHRWQIECGRHSNDQPPPFAAANWYGVTLNLGYTERACLSNMGDSTDGTISPTTLFKEYYVVKLVVRDKESIQEAVRRFRKLVERSGIKKEMRRREYYEKPSETKRRARLRAERRGLRTRRLAEV